VTIPLVPTEDQSGNKTKIIRVKKAEFKSKENSKVKKIANLKVKRII